MDSHVQVLSIHTDVVTGVGARARGICSNIHSTKQKGVNRVRSDLKEVVCTSIYAAYVKIHYINVLRSVIFTAVSWLDCEFPNFFLKLV